jgi:hypothetical protein
MRLDSAISNASPWRAFFSGRIVTLQMAWPCASIWNYTAARSQAQSKAGGGFDFPIGGASDRDGTRQPEGPMPPGIPDFPPFPAVSRFFVSFASIRGSMALSQLNGYGASDPLRNRAPPELV